MIPQRELSAEEQALAREMMEVYADALPTDNCTWPINPQAILAVVVAAERHLLERLRAVPHSVLADAYDSGYHAADLFGVHSEEAAKNEIVAAVRSALLATEER